MLSPAQLPAYTRANQDPVNADSLAAEAGDPGLAGGIAPGLLQGARATYQPGPGGGAAFEQVSSQALVFADPAAASAFYAAEVQRRARSAAGGGSVSPLPNLPAGGADQVAGFAAEAAPQVAGGSPLQAYLVVLRRGRVVGELRASGTSPTASVAALTGLLGLEEALLAPAG